MTKELILIKKEIPKIKVPTIKNTSDLTSAVETLSRANKHLDNLTTEKEKLTKPLNQTLKEIRTRYKPLEEQLDFIITSIRQKITIYQTGVENKRLEKENKITQDVIEGKIDLERAVNKMSSIATIEKIETESGSLKFKTVRKFKVVDIKKVPYEYLLLNETLVRQTEDKIPGIEYWNEQIPINHR